MRLGRAVPGVGDVLEPDAPPLQRQDEWRTGEPPECSGGKGQLEDLDGR